VRQRLLPEDPRSLTERFERQRPLEALEVAVVRVHLDQPRLLDADEEQLLRFAISLARLDLVRHAGEDLDLSPLLAPFRDEVLRALSPIFAGGRPARRAAIRDAVRALAPLTSQALARLKARTPTWVPFPVLDRAIRHKELVLVLGGGGGVSFVYLGVLAMLEAAGVRPALLVGTSMGAILALFRSRRLGFDQAETVNLVRSLSWRRLFRAISTTSRYGLPGALRLSLRAGLGRSFHDAQLGRQLRLRELPIPTLVVVGGVRRGMLPRPPEDYAGAMSGPPTRAGLVRRMLEVTGPLAELSTRPGVLARLTLGGDALSAELDAVDAAGFSSALPGVIHYDVTRDDPRAHSILGSLLEQRGISRLLDGGLVDNLPLKVAWRAVHRGAVGTRNALVLGLNGFAPRVSTPHWYPLQKIAALTVAPQLAYGHVVQDFRSTLSPLDVVPDIELLLRAMELGREQFEPQRALIVRMLHPLPERPALLP